MASSAGPKPQRALVTGARGFIGRRLVQGLLARSWEVVCFDRPPARPDGLHGLPVLRLFGDIRDPAPLKRAVDDVSVIFHLAANTAPRSRSLAAAVNVEGTRVVADASSAKACPPIFVYVSSLAAAGPGQTPAVESDPCHPVSIYGRTKRDAEDVLAQFASRLPITIVRPPCVFGGGDRNLLELVKWVQRGWNFHTGAQNQYSFLHVDDLVTGLLLAAEKGRRLDSGTDRSHPGVYFLTDPHPVTFPDLAAMLANTLGVQHIRHVRVPRALAWLSAVGAEMLQRVTGMRVYLNRDKVREGFAGSWVCDGRRAECELGFVIAKRLPDRLNDTIHDYRAEGWL